MVQRVKHTQRPMRRHHPKGRVAQGRVVALMFTIFLVGCTSASPDGKDASDPSRGDSILVPIEANASARTSESVGGDAVEHRHDYWQGRSRVTLFEGPGEMSPAGSPPDYAAANLTLPPGQTVYEGTH